ncbi:MAG: DUF4332 domain-containing protein [Candidatus Aminicenantes bacterium]|nr:DUF4332 domain-containing protein [Candidatus Aminicenantes bacterium]
MTGIKKIEGIGDKFTSKLNAIGIRTMNQLLDEGATPAGRHKLEERTGISPKMILRWVNMADLFRIKGIGEEYSDLLEAAGVDTVPELAQRKAENLYAKMSEVNKSKKLVRQLPGANQVAKWIEQAKSLNRKVNY